MSNEKEWQEANRELIAEERRRLGDPPTAEEMLAFTRGELSESEEERIRDLLVVYPELASMYGEPFPDEPRPGDPDYVSEAETAASWNALQQRLRKRSDPARPARDEAQRGRFIMHYVPAAVAAVLAIVFFGLYVQAEGRARYHARESSLPHVLGAPQELFPDGNRGPGAAVMLRKDGEAYLLQPRLSNQPLYPHYQLELRDANAVIWSNRNAKLSNEDTFQIVIPHAFLRGGETYHLRIFGVDGERPTLVGAYDVSAPAE